MSLSDLLTRGWDLSGIPSEAAPSPLTLSRFDQLPLTLRLLASPYGDLDPTQQGLGLADLLTRGWDYSDPQRATTPADSTLHYRPSDLRPLANLAGYWQEPLPSALNYDDFSDPVPFAQATNALDYLSDPGSTPQAAQKGHGTFAGPGWGVDAPTATSSSALADWRRDSGPRSRLAPARPDDSYSFRSPLRPPSAAAPSYDDFSDPVPTTGVAQSSNDPLPDQLGGPPYAVALRNSYAPLASYLLGNRVVASDAAPARPLAGARYAQEDGEQGPVPPRAMRMLRGLTGATQPSGQWVTTNESMSERAASYQAQITGKPTTQGYLLNGVKFDGFDGKNLLEAKGPGYAQHLTKDGVFDGYFQGGKGIVDQATRQMAASEGFPVEWHVAEKDTAEAIAKLLKNFDGITVIYTPPK